MVLEKSLGFFTVTVAMNWGRAPENLLGRLPNDSRTSPFAKQNLFLLPSLNYIWRWKN